jgi:hypothetical protein
MDRTKFWPIASLTIVSLAAGCAGNARSPLAADALQLRLSQSAFAFPQLQLPKGEITFPPAAPANTKTGGQPALPNPCDVNDNMPVGGLGSDTIVARMPAGGFPAYRGWLHAVRMPNPCFVEEPVR